MGKKYKIKCKSEKNKIGLRWFYFLAHESGDDDKIQASYNENRYTPYNFDDAARIHKLYSTQYPDAEFVIEEV